MKDAPKTPEDAWGYVVPWMVMRQIAEDIARPLPAFYQQPPLPPQPFSLRRELRWRIAAWRERIGFAVAGYTPSEDDY